MKTIIVATDFSKAASNALLFGAEIARSSGARIILFNATQVPASMAYASYLPSAKPSVDELKEANKSRLTEAVEKLSQSYSVSIEPVAGAPQLYDELDKLVRLHAAELVIMGMRGKSLQRDILGSNTLSVIQRAHFPVLMVPEEASYREFKNILLACDYDSPSLVNRLAFLKELAVTYKSKIEILHIEKNAVIAMGGGPKTYSQQHELETMFGDISHSYRFMKGYDVVSGIVKEADVFKADLVVMLPDHTSMFDIMLQKSNTRKVALKTSIPLLALPKATV
jgi:nucleotide-binding universal stress UspA family protein